MNGNSGRFQHGPKPKCVAPECGRASKNLRGQSLCQSYIVIASRKRREAAGRAVGDPHAKNLPGGDCLVADCPAVAQPSGYCSHHQRQIGQGVTLTKAHRPRLVAQWGNELPGGIRADSKACDAPECLRTCPGSNRLCKRHINYARRMNLTAERYLEVLGDGSCNACGGAIGSAPKYPAVDHDHACCPGTGYSCGTCIRGLLCLWCNSALGYAQESAERLRALADYLSDRA